MLLYKNVNIQPWQFGACILKKWRPIMIVIISFLVCVVSERTMYDKKYLLLPRLSYDLISFKLRQTHKRLG